MLVVFAVLLVVIAGLALLGGGALLTGRRGQPGEGPLLALPFVGIAAGGVVVLFLLLLVGVRGPGGDDGDAAAPDPTPSGTTTTVPVTTTVPTGAGLAGDRIALVAGATAVVDRLPEDAGLRLSVAGFDPSAVGTVRQCRVRLTGTADCTNRLPLLLGFNGATELHYLLAASVGGDPCTGSGAPCAVVASANGRQAVLYTVFGEAAPPPGRIDIRPAGDLADGDRVTVTATGFPAATALSVAQCGPVGDDGTRTCGTPVEAQTDRRGEATVHLRVGRTAACAERSACSIAVAAEAPLAPMTHAIAFAGGPTADYDPGRLALFGTLAVALLALAVWLIRHTDWHEPAGAATPELDAAVLE